MGSLWIPPIPKPPTLKVNSGHKTTSSSVLSFLQPIPEQTAVSCLSELQLIKTDPRTVSSSLQSQRQINVSPASVRLFLLCHYGDILEKDFAVTSYSLSELSIDDGLIIMHLVKVSADVKLRLVQNPAPG
ncbi:hypothetical protein MHYP_G00140350 [Metynnis hypsauchen]